MAKKKRQTAGARLSGLMNPNPFRVVGQESRWRDPKIWAQATAEALSVENLDAPIRLAFEAFKLDPLNPYDWRLLLHALASVHFDIPKAKAGAPTVWRDSDWCQLLADYYKVRARYPGRTKSEVCRFMKRDSSFKDRIWFDKTPETIRRNISRALSPRYNKYIKLIDQFEAQVISKSQVAACTAGRAWALSDEMTARSSACEDLVPAIEALAGRLPGRRAARPGRGRTDRGSRQ